MSVQPIGPGPTGDGQKKPLSEKAERRAKAEARKSMRPQQIRARARKRGGMDTLTQKEKEALLGKPMAEWDLEELARGYPRNKNGNFGGAPPKWITREMHEKSITMFKDMMRADMRSHTVRALQVLAETLDDDAMDEKGRPVTPTGVKVDVAKFLIEHLVGKPTQPVEADISIKLQHILGAALVMPAELTSMQPSASHRVLEGEIVEDGDED